jgi:hypothetical protein
VANPWLFGTLKDIGQIFIMAWSSNF